MMRRDGRNQLKIHKLDLFFLFNGVLAVGIFFKGIFFKWLRMKIQK